MYQQEQKQLLGSISSPVSQMYCRSRSLACRAGVWSQAKRYVHMVIVCQLQNQSLDQGLKLISMLRFEPVSLRSYAVLACIASTLKQRTDSLWLADYSPVLCISVVIYNINSSLICWQSPVIIKVRLQCNVDMQIAFKDITHLYAERLTLHLRKKEQQ